MKTNKYPKDWEKEKLEVLGSFSKGKGISKIELKENGFPCIRYGDIYTKYNFFADKLNSFIDNESAKMSVIIKTNDILFTGSGETANEIGKAIAYVGKEEAYAGGDVILFRPKDVNSIFLSYALNSSYVIRQKINFGEGYSIVHIYPEELKQLLILLPPEHEQLKIANIFYAYEIHEQKLNNLISKKLHLKNALMQQLLTGKKRFKEFSKSNWKEKKLSSCLQSVSRPIERPNNKYIALGIRSHGKGTFLREVNNPEEIMMDELYQVKENDLIVNITFAWEGAIAIVNKTDERALVSHRFPTFTFKTEELLPDFFRYLMLQKQFTYNLGLISPGGAGRNRVLNKTDLLKLKIFIPAVDEQKMIASTLISVDKEIELLRAKLELHKRQKKGLMQKLLTGKIRVKV